MQAVILAGGPGTRLRPLTQHMPKVMVPINGAPFLLHLLKLLKSQGVKNIILCTGYLGKQVKDFLGDGKNLGLTIRYSEEKEKLLGTGGALKQAQSWLNSYFLVLNGDTYLPIDYGELERAFRKRRKQAMMVVYANRENTGVKNNVALDNDLMVIRHDKEGFDPNLKYVEAGVLVLQREALDIIKEGAVTSLEKGLYPTLIQQRELAAYVAGQRFYDIGTPEQKQIFEKFLKERAK